MTVGVLVEIMWSFVSQTPSLLSAFLGHFMKLLTSKVSGQDRCNNGRAGHRVFVSVLAEPSDQLCLCQDIHAAAEAPSAVKTEGSAST